MILGSPPRDPVMVDLGFSLNPISAIKKGASAVGHGVVSAGKATVSAGKAVGRGTKTAGKAVAHTTVSAGKAVGHGATVAGKAVAHNAGTVAKLAVLPVVTLNKYVLSPVLKVALSPVRSKINTLKDRRARKLAWDRRKSKTPNEAEKREAQSWAKSHMRGQTPPLGLMLSLLAGPPSMGALGDAGDFDIELLGTTQIGALGEPATATIAASVPALLALITAILSRTSKSGEAPIDPSAGAAPEAPIAPGEVDMSPAQDAAEAAGDLVDTAAQAANTEALVAQGVPRALAKHGITKKQMMIGGAILGGAVLLAVLTSRRSAA